MRIIHRIQRLAAVALSVVLLGSGAFAARRQGGKSKNEPVRVACIGNSITYGFLVEDREHNAYPVKLQQLLGKGYDVRNFGKSGATLLRRGHRPYDKQAECDSALRFRPDIALIHLGINDTDPRDWPDYGDEFVGDYLALIDTLRALRPGVRVIVANLTPLGPAHPRWRSGTMQWRDSVRAAIRRVAEAADAELIDFADPLIDSPQLLPEAIHPNVEGADRLARYAYGAVSGDWGGLKMSPLYADSMVVQRRRPIRVAGRDDAGRRVTVTFGGQRRSAVADNLGDWEVSFLPMEAATGLTMTVDDGKDRLEFKDVAVGEVWIASGQSNMEFRLSADREAKNMLPEATDPGLRLFDMKAKHITDSHRWDSTALAEVNRLEYYRPATWRTSSPETARDFSAVAWYFARRLRQELDVPVGIICNAVGGATTESFIDQETLRHNMPEVLVNWRKNDYLQPWAQKRAGENAPADANPGQRHPYEPGYLYSAGVKPLGSPDVAGVIWYQGESNAHNVQVHEQLFPLMVETWRKELRQPDLPFYFVQLSSINRPSWPTMRDSQRRMAQSMGNVGMAVSSDVGDSLDVHPRIKRPVGERLARIALHDTYGFDNIEPGGPAPLSAITSGDGTVTLVMSHADGLRTSDGQAPRTFEVAEIEGLYVPAEARISGNTVTLSGHGLAKPRYLRYGWQPFTRANLVNSNNLPTSTFKMEVTNTTPSKVAVQAVDGTPRDERGIERGVSAAYAGMAGAQPVMAGGCNFPQKDPLAADAVKKFYQGVYAATPADGGLKWKKVAELPHPAAYGVSAPTAQGLFIAGGLSPEGPLRDAMMINVGTDGKATVMPLSPAPADIDNAYGASDGMTVYVVGGNVGGKPSNRVWAYSVADDSWTEIAPMPGNPRVQPVAAVSGGKLYVWGGFAGRHDGIEPTLELGGLCYDPATGRWNEVAGAENLNGEKLGLGGGVALPLPDGRIIAAGGVNPEVFLAALTAQPADYLMHDPSWYRFNKSVVIYNPATDSWAEAATDSEAARAGASLIDGGDGSLYLLGGEIKPRIRTPRAFRVTVR